MIAASNGSHKLTRHRPERSRRSWRSAAALLPLLLIAFSLGGTVVFGAALLAADPAAGPLPDLLGPADPYWGTVADRPQPGKNPASLYRGESIDNNLFFEIGNRAVLAAISPRGGVEGVRIFTGNDEAHVPLPGVWQSFRRLQWTFAARHPLRFGLEIGGRTFWIDDQGRAPEMSLAGGVWPTVATRLGPCRAKQTFLCPVDSDGRPVRALLMALDIEPSGSEPVTGQLRIPAVATVTATGSPPGICEATLLDEPAPLRNVDRLPLTLRPGASRRVVVALVLAESQAELADTRRRLASRTGRQWMESTAAFYARRLVRLRVDGRDHPAASMLRRMQCVAMMTPLETGAGMPVGTSWGTLLYDRDWIWMTDAFYNYLGAGLSDPSQWLAGARFFAFRSFPGPRAVAYWQHEKRYQKYRAVELASRVDGVETPHSLTNLLAPVVLAATYYRLTGDIEAIRHATAIDPATGRALPLIDRLHALVAKVLASRRPQEPWLFRSVWISDGPARGRYHTGSNIYAWYALSEMARIAKAIDPRDPRAQEYAAAADRVRLALGEHCRIELDGRTLWNEGSDLRRLYHDGEQSATTLAPALGFCRADDPELLRYKQWGCSPRNPLWSPTLSAFIWPADGDRYATFPGYISELASVDNDAQLQQKLDKLFSFCDADGQWWWWPEQEGKGARVLRGPAGKCGWATSVFLTRFVHCNLGVDWDAPTRTLAVRPFVPWSVYNYDGLVVGSLRLDYQTTVSADGARVRLTHNQPQLDELTLSVRAPPGTREARLLRAPARSTLRQVPDYFGLPTWEIRIPRPEGNEVKVELAWAGPPHAAARGGSADR